MNPSLLNQFYLDKYSRLSFIELIKELNEVTNPNKITKCLIISTRIVYYITQLIGGSGFKNNLDLQTSAAMSLILRRLKNDKPIKFDEVESIVKTEINFVSNLIFNSKSTNFTDMDGYYDSDCFGELVLEELKKELIRYVPEHLKLSMYNFIKTSIIDIDNYSDLDKYLFYSSLSLNGYELDMEAKNYLLELETVTEKALFLELLSKEHPTLFILFTSLKSMNELILLSKLESLNLPSPLQIMGIFKEIYDKVRELTGQVEYKNLPKSMIQFSKEIVEDESGIELLDLVKRAMDKLYDNFEVVAESVTKSAENRGNLGIVAQQLNKEVEASTKFIQNVQKIAKKAI